MTVQHQRGIRQRQAIGAPTKPPARRSKYGAIRCEADGFAFDSLAEKARYEQLALLQKAGEISHLKVHPHFALVVPESINGVEDFNEATFTNRRIVGEYEADFSYRQLAGTRWTLVIEDVKRKATSTALYRWKKRHFEIQYGLPIMEIR